jgi:hypothetical protein
MVFLMLQLACFDIQNLGMWALAEMSDLTHGSYPKSCATTMISAKVFK